MDTDSEPLTYMIPLDKNNLVRGKDYYIKLNPFTRIGQFIAYGKDAIGEAHIRFNNVKTLEGKLTDKYLSFNADEYKYYELDTNEEILPQYLIRGHNYIFKRITKLIGTFRHKFRSEPTISFNNVRLTDGTELYPVNDTLISQRYKNFGVPFDINSCVIYEVKKDKIIADQNRRSLIDIIDKNTNSSIGSTSDVRELLGGKQRKKSYRKKRRKNKSKKLKQYK